MITGVQWDSWQYFINMPIDLFEAEQKLADYLNYKGSSFSLPFIDWFEPSQSEAYHKSVSGNLIVSLQPNQQTNNGAREQINYDLAAVINMVVRGEDKYITRQNAAIYYAWLWRVARELRFTGAIVSDEQLSTDIWASGNILSSSREKLIMSSIGGKNTFVSAFYVEYRSLYLDDLS